MKTIVAAALGECAHAAGVMNFLRLAEAATVCTRHHEWVYTERDMVEALPKVLYYLESVCYRAGAAQGEVNGVCGRTGWLERLTQQGDGQ